MNAHAFDPWGLARLALLQQKISITAAQTIMSRSALFMQGDLTHTEATQMWMEKPAAMMSGMQNAVEALVSGKNMPQMMEAALGPMADKTSANAERLKR